jgi:hypothetical protein
MQDKDGNVKDHFMQHHFVELHNKKKVKGITLLNEIFK